MSKRQKAIEKLRRNPKHVRFETVDSLLLGLGLDKRRGCTSHTIYSLGPHRVNIPFRRPFIGPKYAIEVLSILDKMDESSPED